MIIFDDCVVYLGNFAFCLFDERDILPQKIVYTSSRQGLILYTHRIDIRLA